MLLIRLIYDCIESSLLLYKIFSATLEGLGFEINHYDISVPNNIIEGTQYTISG